MKKYWHTGTLFLQNWKYYKWSYKFDFCIECKTCNFKHKGRWLCTSCRDKERDKNETRKKQKYNISKKWHKKNYEPVKERKKRKSNFNPVEYRKKYYNENKEVIKYLAKVYRMKKKWLQCIKIIINWKQRFLPFTELLEKPTTTWLNFKIYEEWKEEQRIFDLIKLFYNK